MRVPPSARATGTVKITQAGISFMYSENKFEIVLVRILLFCVVGALDRNVSSTNRMSKVGHDIYVCVLLMNVAAHQSGK